MAASKRGGGLEGQGDTILEDMDSENDFSADLNYNYDVINLKEESNPFHEPIKNILLIYNKRRNEGGDADSDEEFNPEKAL